MPMRRLAPAAPPRKVTGGLRGGSRTRSGGLEVFTTTGRNSRDVSLEAYWRGTPNWFVCFVWQIAAIALPPLKADVSAFQVSKRRSKTGCGCEGDWRQRLRVSFDQWVGASLLCLLPAPSKRCFMVTSLQIQDLLC